MHISNARVRIAIERWPSRVTHTGRIAAEAA